MTKSLEKLIRWIEANDKFVSTGLGVLVVVVIGSVGMWSFWNLEWGWGEKPEVEQLGREIETNNVVHVVAPGEGLSSIAQTYYGERDMWGKIAEANSITNPNLIEIGQKLIIPIDEVFTGAGQTTETGFPISQPETANGEYVVKKGDYLSKIAIEVYGNRDKWVDILEANRDIISNPEILVEGTVLKLP